MTRTHGHASTGNNSPTYRTWRSMRKRCLDKAHLHYDRYGGAGVTICERWDSFENFLADMGERPEGKTLDRYPVKDGNYEPGNCRWATKREQALNRKSTVWIEIDGQRKCIKEWAAIYGINKQVVGTRLRLGWEPVRALTQPTKEYRERKN
jgi:hypothetical protein